MKRCSRHAWYDLSEAERRRDVFRAASKKQLEAYMTALSSTLTLLQDHPDLLHLSSGVEPSLAQLGLAQHGEVFALPLEQGGREAFFETLLAQLLIASGLGAEAETEDRPQFLLVLKSIGQKVRRYLQFLGDFGGGGGREAAKHWILNGRLG